jgi:hypothetical protein
MQFHLTGTEESAEIVDQHDLRLPPAGLFKCHSFTVVRRRKPEGHNVQHANSFHSVVFGLCAAIQVRIEVGGWPD